MKVSVNGLGPQEIELLTFLLFYRENFLLKPTILNQALGRLIDESHDSLKVKYNVSIDELDNLTQVTILLIFVDICLNQQNIYRYLLSSTKTIACGE